MASPTFLQSISQNLALTWRRRYYKGSLMRDLRRLTVVVKLTQSLTKVSGVLPVTSSH